MLVLRTALPLATKACEAGDQFTVERLLRDVAGVRSTVANPVLEMVYVEYDPALTDPDALFAVLRHAGLAPPDRIAVRQYRPPPVSGWRA